jgi:hypothetical protein
MTRTATDVIESFWTHPQLATLQQMLAEPAAHELLRSVLCKLLTDGAVLGPFRLEWAEFKPGRKIVAHFQVEAHCPNAAEHDARPFIAVWTPRTDTGEADAIFSPGEFVPQAQGCGRFGPWKQLVTNVPRLGLHVQGWPLDNEFFQIARVCDPSHVSNMIAAATTSCECQGLRKAASCYSVAPVRYRPGERHVLRYSPLDGSERPSSNGILFGKLYDSANSTERAFGVANRVADSLLFGAPELKALRPWGYAADDAVVLYPAASGAPLSSFLGPVTPALAHWLRQAGAMLQMLHSDPSEHGGSLSELSRPGLFDDLDPHRGFAKEVKKITRHTCEHIHALLPKLGASITEMLEHARKLYDQIPYEPPAFAHGDFKTEHLWVHRGGVTLIDFDTSCVADPALDVGKFLADLRWWYMTKGHNGIEAAQRHFLDGYAHGTRVDRLARARIYESVLLIRLAVHRTQLFDVHWPERTEELVRLSAQILEEVAG